MSTLRLFLFLLTIGSFGLCTAQKSTPECTDSKRTIKMVHTKDGGTIFGELVKKSDSTITINNNSLGVVTIPMNQVSLDKDVVCSRIIDGEYWFENPSSNFYMISPSAFPLAKNTFYYRNEELFFNAIGYSITKNIVLNAGFDFPSLFQLGYGHSVPAFMVMPQYYFKMKDKFRMGASFLYINGENDYFNKAVGIPLFNIAYGTEDRNIGFAYGKNIVKWERSESQKQFILAGGIYRVTNRFGFQGEFLQATGNHRIYTYGFRFFARNMSIDFGFLNNKEIREEILPIGIPIVSFTLKNK